MKRVKAKYFADIPTGWGPKLARWLMRQSGGFVVWDTETTGLTDDARIVSIGAVDQDGEVLLDMLINPQVPIPPGATAIHGVTDEMVADAPAFEQAYSQIREALSGRRWVIYNKDYDVARLDFACKQAYEAMICPREYVHTRRYRNWFYTQSHREVYCAMQAFAVQYGDFSEYYGSYKWKSLSFAADHYGVRIKNAHNALADAKATLGVLRGLSMDEVREEKTA